MLEITFTSTFVLFLLSHVNRLIVFLFNNLILACKLFAILLVFHISNKQEIQKLV